MSRDLKKQSIPRIIVVVVTTPANKEGFDLANKSSSKMNWDGRVIIFKFLKCGLQLTIGPTPTINRTALFCKRKPHPGRWMNPRQRCHRKQGNENKKNN
ncbi:hypothetical protein HHI36_010059, partial [Cryptolaemus montrouzieri]